MVILGDPLEYLIPIASLLRGFDPSIYLDGTTSQSWPSGSFGWQNSTDWQWMSHQQKPNLLHNFQTWVLDVFFWMRKPIWKPWKYHSSSCLSPESSWTSTEKQVCWHGKTFHIFRPFYFTGTRSKFILILFHFRRIGGLYHQHTVGIKPMQPTRFSFCSTSSWIILRLHIEHWFSQHSLMNFTSSRFSTNICWTSPNCCLKLGNNIPETAWTHGTHPVPTRRGHPLRVAMADATSSAEL